MQHQDSLLSVSFSTPSDQARS